jgi:hypothetical protein
MRFECLNRVSIIFSVAAPWNPPVFLYNIKEVIFLKSNPRVETAPQHAEFKIETLPSFPYTLSKRGLLKKGGSCFFYKAPKCTYNIHNSRSLYHSNIFRLYCAVLMNGVIRDYTVVHVACACCRFSERKYVD